MKKAGFIVFIVGLIVTIFTGLNYVTKEVVVNSGDLSITRDVNHGFSWSPLVGVAIMILGAFIFAAGFRQQRQLKKA